MKIVNFVFIKILRFYRRWISPLKSPTCRYYPSCSSYSLTLFRLTSPMYALFFSIIRVLKCNPLFKGGYDYPSLEVRIIPRFGAPIKVLYWIIPCRDLSFHLLPLKQIRFKAYIIFKEV